MKNPRVIDNDKDEITVSLSGRELRGWRYLDDAERRQKMRQAREYVEGWCDASENSAMRSALQLVRKYMQEEVGEVGVELLTAENRAIWDAVNGALGEPTDAK
jgi:hypothetical protein